MLQPEPDKFSGPFPSFYDFVRARKFPLRKRALVLRFFSVSLPTPMRCTLLVLRRRRALMLLWCALLMLLRRRTLLMLLRRRCTLLMLLRRSTLHMLLWWCGLLMLLRSTLLMLLRRCTLLMLRRRHTLSMRLRSLLFLLILRVRSRLRRLLVLRLLVGMNLLRLLSRSRLLRLMIDRRSSRVLLFRSGSIYMILLLRGMVYLGRLIIRVRRNQRSVLMPSRIGVRFMISSRLFRIRRRRVVIHRLGLHCARLVERARTRSGRDSRIAVVCRCELSAIGRGPVLVLRLYRQRILALMLDTQPVPCL